MQGRCVMWIIALALQINCDPMVLLGDSKLVSKGLQQLYVSWCSFCILAKTFASPFEVQQLPFPWFVFDFKQQKMIEFEEKLVKGLSPL